MQDIIQKAFELAKDVREKAYAPYSKFHVGAALKVVGDENIYTGCNVENASYGATVCAERNAIFSRVALGKMDKIEFMVLITGNSAVDVPCGMCLQVMSEFCTSDTDIHLSNLDGIQKTLKFSQLMPFTFDKSAL